MQSLQAAQASGRPPHSLPGASRLSGPPMRTCVGCRVVRPQSELLRTRCPGGRVAATSPGAPGRSAYVCPSRTCVESAVRKGGFKRSFRSNTIAEVDVLWTALAADVKALERRNQCSAGPDGSELHPSGRNA